MLSLGAFGVAAAIFHLVAHGVSKAMLFLGAGSVMHGMHEETNIWKMGGLRRMMPITAATFVIGAPRQKVSPSSQGSGVERIRRFAVRSLIQALLFLVLIYP